jgi:hypothetical protein
MNTYFIEARADMTVKWMYMPMLRPVYHSS